VVQEKLAYTITEVAKVTGFSAASIYRWCHDGRLRLKRVGARTFVTREELLRFLDEAPEIASKQQEPK
jgi:excisionase family DNA binding protein